MSVSKMIVNWFGLHPRTGKSKYREVVNNIDDSKPAEISEIYMNECPFVREFVIKIAEKIRRGVFSYRPFTDYSNGNGALEYNSPSLCYKFGEDIVSISIFLNSLVLRVGYDEITLSKSEEKVLYKEWIIAVEQENKRHIENEKIEKEYRANKIISKIEEHFND